MIFVLLLLFLLLQRIIQLLQRASADSYCSNREPCPIILIYHDYITRECKLKDYLWVSKTRRRWYTQILEFVTLSLKEVSGYTSKSRCNASKTTNRRKVLEHCSVNSHLLCKTHPRGVTHHHSLALKFCLQSRLFLCIFIGWLLLEICFTFIAYPKFVHCYCFCIFYLFIACSNFGLLTI